MFIWLFCLLSSSVQARESQLFPIVQEAFAWGKKSAPMRPTVAVAWRLLQREKLMGEWSQKFLGLKSPQLPLVVLPKKEVLPKISLQALRLDVIEPSDDFLKDNLYCYFFMTDGTVPTGKVTDIYKGLSAGESVFFSPLDRPLFPLQAGAAQSPRATLLVDYGIIESDGDDIKKMQQLTGLIAELAVAVYAMLEPEEAAQWGSLRQEMVALAQAVTGLNQDDRLALGTLVLDSATIERTLGSRGFGDISKVHHSGAFLNKWRYRLSWRLLKE